MSLLKQSAYHSAVRLIVATILVSTHSDSQNTRPPTPLSRVPKTDFDCQGRPAGYYADIKANCQSYHMCDSGRKYSYLCPAYTLFHQKFMVCNHWHSVNCSETEQFFDLNLKIGKVPDKTNENENAIHSNVVKPQKVKKKEISRPQPTSPPRKFSTFTVRPTQSTTQRTTPRPRLSTETTRFPPRTTKSTFSSRTGSNFINIQRGTKTKFKFDSTTPKSTFSFSQQQPTFSQNSFTIPASFFTSTVAPVTRVSDSFFSGISNNNGRFQNKPRLPSFNPALSPNTHRFMTKKIPNLNLELSLPSRGIEMPFLDLTPPSNKRALEIQPPSLNFELPFSSPKQFRDLVVPSLNLDLLPPPKNQFRELVVPSLNLDLLPPPKNQSNRPPSFVHLPTFIGLPVSEGEHGALGRRAFHIPTPRPGSLSFPPRKSKRFFFNSNPSMPLNFSGVMFAEVKHPVHLHGNTQELQTPLIMSSRRTNLKHTQFSFSRRKSQRAKRPNKAFFIPSNLVPPRNRFPSSGAISLGQVDRNLEKESGENDIIMTMTFSQTE